jgi:hypothetical protein
MVIGQPTMQRIVQLLGARLDSPVGEFGQLERISDALNSATRYSSARKSRGRNLG